MADRSREPFKERQLPDERRLGDVRGEYGRDDARVVHGAAFRGTTAHVVRRSRPSDVQ